MEDLIRLEGCHPREGSIATSVFQGGRSPLCWKEWDAGLRTHPDQRFRQYIVKGIQSGFRIGFDYRNTCWSKKRNMMSAVENPQVVHNYLEEECKAGRVVGPLCPGEYPFVHTSSFGVYTEEYPGEVEAHSGPVVTRRGQCQRWNKRVLVFPDLCHCG